MYMAQLPNIITVMRVGLTIPAAVALYRESYQSALIVFFVAGCSDALDGFLARRYNWFSRFGELVDPLADKILLITTFCVLATTEKLNDTVLYIILARDCIILMGALAYFWVVGELKGEPSLLGKLCTLLQIVFALLLIYSFEPFLEYVPSDQFLNLFSCLVVLSCLLSGTHYVLVWSYKAYRHQQINKQ